MKTLKIGMFAAALLLIFAGCKNAVAPTPYSESEFAKNADEYNNYPSSTMGYDFKLNDSYSSPITVTGNYLGNADDYLVKIMFTNEPDKESLKNGVKFYELSNSEGNKAYLMPKKAALPSSLIEVRDNNAYFKVTKKDLTCLYGFIDAKIVKAAKGVKLNQDEDQIYGEEHDDSYAFYKQVSGAAPIGNIDFEKAALDVDSWSSVVLNATISFSSVFSSVFSPTFPTVGGTGADKYFVEKCAISSTTFKSTYLDGIDLTEAEKDAKYAEMTNLFNKHLKIEQYDWKKAEWLNVPVTFSYDKTNNQWVTDKITSKLEKNRKLRYKFVDMYDIKINFKNKYGYPIKALLKNTDKRVKEGFLVNTCYTSSLAEGDTWKFTNSELTVTKTTKGSVTIKFNPKKTDTYSAFKDSTWHSDVTVATKGDSTKTLYKGFDKKTLAAGNFKMFMTYKEEKKNNNGVFVRTKYEEEQLAIKSVTLRCSNMNSSNVLDEIYIELNDATITPELKYGLKADGTQVAYDDAGAVIKREFSTDVYISPDVRTLSFVGSYKGGTEEYPIPAMGFVDIKSSDDPNVLGGWLKK